MSVWIHNSLGVLGASIRYGSSSFEIGDCSGAQVWVRNLQFTAVKVEVPFTYLEPNGTTKEGTAIIPGGSPAGTTVQATLDAEFPDAVKILGSIYAGILSFDIFMGKGTYPRLWLAPELQAVDVSLELVLTATPEVGLLENIRASLEAKLDSYKIGEALEYAGPREVYLHGLCDGLGLLWNRRRRQLLTDLQVNDHHWIWPEGDSRSR